jgi:hypothetical protein
MMTHPHWEQKSSLYAAAREDAGEKNIFGHTPVSKPRVEDDLLKAPALVLGGSPSICARESRLC